jgi:sulfur-carrier protein
VTGCSAKYSWVNLYFINMRLHVILFGRLADIAGSSVFVNGAVDTDSLIKTLQNTYPALAESKYAIAVDKHIITSNTLLSENSVIALLPPFSGG